MQVDRVITKEEPLVSVPTLNETQLILVQALRRLGPNGERWHQGSCGVWLKDGTDFSGPVCAVTSLGQTIQRSTDALHYLAGRNARAYGFLANSSWGMSGKSPENLNDAAKDFSEVRAMFEKAIELAGQS